MSELTREKKCQIAAMAVKGKTAEEIAAEAKVDIEAVKALLATRSAEKKVDDMSMNEKKDYAVRLYHQGKTRKEIIELTGLSQSAVYTLIPASKGDQKGKPHKKKEPAPAATDTSSSNENINSLYPNDNIDELKSQPLSGISGSNNIEAALEEWLGNEKEIVYLKADTESAEVRFKCDGRVYSMTFRRYA